jgi:hypothetical protein
MVAIYARQARYKPRPGGCTINHHDSLRPFRAKCFVNQITESALHSRQGLQFDF